MPPLSKSNDVLRTLGTRVAACATSVRAFLRRALARLVATE